uniref:InlB B-repeat-containing protein n=1 Tax=Flavobacterium sp. TaxID=239 RepID=UPI004048FFD4
MKTSKSLYYWLALLIKKRIIAYFHKHYIAEVKKVNSETEKIMKKHIYLAVILTLIFCSCSTEEPIPTHTLAVSVSPAEAGKITISPQSPDYKAGDLVTLSAEPNEHWVFKQWEGDVSGSSNPLQITMNTNKSVVGVFVKRDYPLNITITGEGTVEEKIVPNPGGREYPYETNVELTPNPKEGWVFESWG